MELSHARILENNYLVVERILRFANTEDLFRCAEVCSLWKNVSGFILESRYRVQWLSHTFSSTLNENEILNAVSCSRLPGRHPKCVLVFYTRHSDNGVHSGIDQELPQDKEISNQVLNCFRQCLPDSCIIHCFRSRKVCAFYNKNALGKTDGESDNFVAVALPNVPGVDISPYSFDLSQNISPVGGLQFSLSIPEAVVQWVNSIPKPKTVLTLNVPPGYFTNECIVKEFGGTCAVSGIQVSYMNSTCGNVLRPQICSGVTLSGRNVMSSSLEAWENETCAEVEERLKDLFRGFAFRKNGFALAFVSRLDPDDKAWTRNIEVFCRLYPKVPVVGVLGGRAFGRDFPSTEWHVDEGFRLVPIEDTVFLYISLSPGAMPFHCES